MAPKPRSGEVGAAALARGLHDALTAAQGARVVVVSSSAQSPVVFDDIHFTFRPYDAYCAYAQSKAATILFTVAIANRWAVDAITANALNPGGVVTNIQRHLAQTTLRSIGALDEHNRPLAVPRGWKTPQQGAATSVLLAASPLVEGVTGRCFEDCNEAVVLTEPGATARAESPPRPRSERRRPPLGRNDPAPAPLTPPTTARSAATPP